MLMPDRPAGFPVPFDANARLAAIIESSDDAIVSKTLQGIITTWNRGAERIFGYTADEIVGKPMSTIFPVDRLEEEPAILARLARGEFVEHFETVRRTKEGRLIDVSVTISPMRDATGKIVGASKIARDITRQKQIERELRQARDDAEAANRAKDKFLSVLSHELRTPLTPVLAVVNLIEASPDLSTDELFGYLQMIRRNVETEARLVDDLLDVTHISRGKVRLHTEAVDVHTALRGVVAMLQSEIDAKGLEVAFALGAKDRNVWADPGRLQQVVLNLLANAVKFTPPDGRIAIRTSDEDGIRIEISDTGIGIDPQTMPRLFRPFEQGETTVTRRFGGLGLGLSIARSLVELHGGSLTATSEGLNRGSTFTLHFKTIPTGQKTVPTGPAVPAAKADLLKGCRILLVEDHDDTRNMAQPAVADVRLRRDRGVHRLAGRGVRRPAPLRHAAQRHRPAGRQRPGRRPAGPGPAKHSGHRAQRLRPGRRPATKPRGGVRAAPGQTGELPGLAGTASERSSLRPVRRMSGRRPNGTNPQRRCGTSGRSLKPAYRRTVRPRRRRASGDTRRMRSNTGPVRRTR